jgi:hypothetical protein
MNRFDHQWQRLTARARESADIRETAAPYGFATRVAAQMTTLPATPWEAFERFATRGLFVAGALGLAAVIFDFSATKVDPWDEYPASDIVAAMLDLS